MAAGAAPPRRPAMVLLLRWVEPPFTAYMLRTHWNAQDSGAEGPTIYYRWVDIDDMASCMPLAAVAAEDQTFPGHHGFALQAIRQAFADNMDGDDSAIRGASTISQQTAKNLFLWPARSYIRKAIEAYFTVWMELLWSKQRILAMYLNIAQFDGRVFGVSAAAERLFDTTAAQLTDRQCAALAAVLPAPTAYSAAAPSAYVRRRIRWILQQMQQLGRGYLAPVLGDE